MAVHRGNKEKAKAKSRMYNVLNNIDKHSRQRTTGSSKQNPVEPRVKLSYVYCSHNVYLYMVKFTNECYDRWRGLYRC